MEIGLYLLSIYVYIRTISWRWNHQTSRRTWYYVSTPIHRPPSPLLPIVHSSALFVLNYLSIHLFIYLSFYTYIHLPTKPAGAIVQPLGIVGPQKYKTKVAAQHPPLFIHLSINSFIYPSMLAVGKWFAGLVSVYIIMLDRHCLDISLVFIERWLRPPPTLHLLLLLVLHPPRL